MPWLLVGMKGYQEGHTCQISQTVARPPAQYAEVKEDFAHGHDRGSATCTREVQGLHAPSQRLCVLLPLSSKT